MAPANVDLLIFGNLISIQTEELKRTFTEEKNLSNKLAYIDIVPLGEINDTVRNVNSGLFDELSIIQRQKLYMNQVLLSQTRFGKRITMLYC